jgi:hypothetical protein
MRIFPAFLFVAPLAACAVPSTSSPVAAGAPTAAATDSSDPNALVCRTEKVIGSLVSTERECKTRAQWSEDERENREDLQQRQSVMPTSGPH